MPDESTKFARGISSINFAITGSVADARSRVAEDEAVQVEPLPMAQPLVREEEESLVLDDRAAQIAAKQIALEGRRLRWR